MELCLRADDGGGMILSRFARMIMHLPSANIGSASAAKHRRFPRKNVRAVASPNDDPLRGMIVRLRRNERKFSPRRKMIFVYNKQKRIVFLCNNTKQQVEDENFLTCFFVYGKIKSEKYFENM